MDKIDIYWFSGSGNTLLLAWELEKYLQTKDIAVRLLPIEKSNPQDIDPHAVLGIMTAVAEQGTYSLVWDFLEALPQVAGTGAFLLDSLGAYSGGILGPVKKILRNKGFHPLGAKEILMPNISFKRRCNEEREGVIRSKGVKKVHQFADKLIQGRTIWIDIPFYSRFISFFSRSPRMNALYKKLITVRFHEERCIKCNLCVKLCPVDCITREGNEIPIRSPGSCLLCQRCFAYCPSKAITFGSNKNLPYQAFETGDFLKLINREPVSK